VNWYLTLRLLHIAAAIALIGGLFARQLVRAYAAKTDDVRNFAALSQAAGRIENVMVIPGSLAIIVFGVFLALLTGAPIFGFLQGASRNWLLVSNVLLILMMLAVPLIFLPRGKLFEAALADALAREEMTPELRARMNDPLVRFAHAAEFAVVVIVTTLMVFKPF
jgi:uncharacterized membrane protein